MQRGKLLSIESTLEDSADVRAAECEHGGGRACSEECGAEEREVGIQPLCRGECGRPGDCEWVW